MFKNVVIIVLLVCAGAGGYYAVSTLRIDLGSEGKTEVLRRGDLTPADQLDRRGAPAAPGADEGGGERRGDQDPPACGGSGLRRGSC